jgi:hypothetical protein
MRELGLCVTSAGALHGVKLRAERLGLVTAHFTGQRRWSDAQLKRAVANSYSWDEVLSRLGLSGSYDERNRVKGHALRLGLDLSRIEASKPSDSLPASSPEIKKLRDAAASIAASWFLLRGLNAAIPVEPTVYDLLVTMPDGVKRVQVKTTICRGKDGWTVGVGRRPYSIGNRDRMVPYDPDALDYFFILDGDLTMYLIPSRVIAGRVAILLRNYTKYVVGNVGSLMSCSAAAG